MNTFKAAMRVVAHHRLYLLVYLVGLSIMMMALLLSSMSSLSGGLNTGQTATYQSQKPVVAIVDRDANSGNVASGLRSYLSLTSDVAQVRDSSEQLQDAVATNYTDLIIIIPHGFAHGFTNAARHHGQAMKLSTVTSYTSGSGAMATVQVNGFLSQVRTAFLAGQSLGGAAQASANVTGDAVADLSRACTKVLSAAKDPKTMPAVNMVKTADTSAHTTSIVFGYAMKFGGYPLLASMIVSIALITAVFNETRTRRRIAASPKRAASVSIPVLAACVAVGVLAVAYYAVVSFAVLILSGYSIMAIGLGPILMSMGSMLVYTAIAVALGFLVAQFGASAQAANGVANVAGLLVSFTAGVWFDPSIMPGVMIAVGKMLPGWWYGDAIDRALGTGAYLGDASNVPGWASSTSLLLLFAAAVACLGLAVGAVRRRKPAQSDAGLITAIA